MEKKTVLYFLLWIVMLASILAGVYVIETDLEISKHIVVERVTCAFVVLSVGVMLFISRFASANDADETKRMIYIIISTSVLSLLPYVMYNCGPQEFYQFSAEQQLFVAVSILWFGIVGIRIHHKIKGKWKFAVPSIDLRKLIKNNLDALLISSIALLLYATFTSCSFNEWDSFNFAMALRKFDVAEHQPHPPGHPYYILLGRIFLQFTGNPLTALLTVGVLSGSLIMFPLYNMAKKMYSREDAIVACVTLMVIPGFWLRSEKATADMLFTFIVAYAAYLLYLGHRGNDKLLFASWFILGMGLGSRPVGVALLPLWFYVTFKKRSLWKTVWSLQLFIASILLWLVPVVCINGWDSFWTSFRLLVVGTANVDFISAAPAYLGLMEKRLLMLGRLPFVLAMIFTFGLGGTLPKIPEIFFPVTSSDVSLLLLSVPLYLTVVLGFLGLRRISKKTFMFLWIGPYFVFVYLFGTPTYPRYYIPLLPPLILVLVASTTQMLKWLCQRCVLPKRIQSIIPRVFIVLLIISVFSQSLGYAIVLHTTPAPAIQTVNYVKSNYEPKKTLIIVFHEYRAFQNYGQEFRYMYPRFETNEIIEILKNPSSVNKTVLITESAYRYLRINFGLPPLEKNLQKVAEFHMNPRVEIEDFRIVLYLVTVKTS